MCSPTPRDSEPLSPARAVEVLCTRVGKSWLVTVPELGHTIEVRRLEQARPAVAAVLARALSIEPHCVEIDLVPDLEPEVAAAVREARACAVRVEFATAQLGAANRQAVARLLSQGLTLRDAAALMHLSPQRIHQLSKDTR